MSLLVWSPNKVITKIPSNKALVKLIILRCLEQRNSVEITSDKNDAGDVNSNDDVEDISIQMQNIVSKIFLNARYVEIVVKERVQN